MEGDDMAGAGDNSNNSVVSNESADSNDDVMADESADSIDSADRTDGGRDKAEIEFRTTNGLRFSVYAKLDSTVLSLKSILERKLGFPAPKQRLIHDGRIMEDDQTLRSCGIQGCDMVYLVDRFVPAAPADGSATTNAGSNVGRQRGRPPFGPSFFPELDPDGPGLGENLEFEQMQQQLAQNPNIVRDVLNVPAVQDLANNPEVVRNMIMNNPQMRDVLDRNPELVQILNNPAILRRIMGAARREVININAPNTNPLPNPWASAGTGRRRINLGALGNPIGNRAIADSSDRLRRGNPIGNKTIADSSDRFGHGIFSDFVLNSNPDLTIANETNELMQDPEISQTIHNMLSNPQYLNQMLGFNPELQEMLDSRPWIRDVMQNPEFIRLLATPQVVHALLIRHRYLVSQAAEEEGLNSVEIAQRGSNTAAWELERLMLMFHDLARRAGISPPAASRPQRPPEEVYATQLSQLHEMGFSDTQENIRALIATAGNVHAAVQHLLGL